MSLRHYSAVSIDCDSSACAAKFYDSAPLADRTAEYLAKLAGWQKLSEDRHLCPACAKRREATMSGSQS